MKKDLNNQRHVVKDDVRLMSHNIGSVKSNINEIINDTNKKFTSITKDLRNQMDNVKQEVETKIDLLSRETETKITKVKEGCERRNLQKCTNQIR